MLNTLTCALSGNYVNFGVFNLYDDKALQNSFDVALQVCLQIPLSDVLAYVKLSKAYFAFLEVLFRNHLDVLCGLESPVFIQLVKTNLEGLQSNGMFSIITVKAVLLKKIKFLLTNISFFLSSLDLTVCSLCCSTVDHLATYMFLNQSKVKQCHDLRVYDICDRSKRFFTLLSLIRYPFNTHSSSRLHSPYKHTHIRIHARTHINTHTHIHTHAHT